MDESWRMRMGAPTTRTKSRQTPLPPRRSTEETSSARSSDCTLAAEDFSDVFGGPPRTILSRHQFSAADFTRSYSNPFYEEIFRKADTAAAPSSRRQAGRNLPEFRIPGGSRDRRSDGFYSDIFGIGKEEDNSSRSRSKSKSNSSSVLSSEELSPGRPPAAGEERSFSSFAPKLRPINVPYKWNSSTTMPYHEHSSQPAAFPCNQPSHYENRFPENEYINNFRSPHLGFPQRVPSPETISLNPNSYRSIRTPMDDLELNSPSSVVSSVCQDAEAKSSTIQDKGFREVEMEQEEDEVMSSYVIEINMDNREVTDEALGVDEAIAWAKETFYTQSDDKSWSKRGKDGSSEAQSGFSDGQIDGNGPTGCPVEEETNVCAPEDDEQMEEHMEMELLETELMSWSAGKESNIRLLLSTLHHILWPNSGWYAIPLTNLVESSQVKRAYQKARLCLHPDKLQQRDATIKQKCVAEKAFSVLQEAWAAYISQDVFYS